jgi:hypothetical protein
VADSQERCDYRPTSGALSPDTGSGEKFVKAFFRL